jgi:hypothetical protein
VSLHGDHDHSEHSPKYRRPANAVDPADVAARALAAAEHTDEAGDVEPLVFDEVDVQVVSPGGAEDVADVTIEDALDEARESALEEVREELMEAVLDGEAPEAVEAALEEAEALEGAV